MNQCQPRFHWSPPPTSCCSPSDSLKATRSSEDTSRLFWKSVSHLTKYLYVCMCDPETLSSFLYTECMNMIALPASPGDAGVMTSPFYPSLLPRQCSCTWMFQVLHPIKSFLMCINIIHSIQMGVFCWVFMCQMPSGALGVALGFQNYTLKLKDFQNCEHGWWKVNENM